MADEAFDGLPRPDASAGDNICTTDRVCANIECLNVSNVDGFGSPSEQSSSEDDVLVHPRDAIIEEIAASGPLQWVDSRRKTGHSVEGVLALMEWPMHPAITQLDEEHAWDALVRIIAARCYIRRRIAAHATLDDAVGLIRASRRIVVVTGAGISVNSGIPDFRSPGGLYDRVRTQFNMPEPECMFDAAFFRQDPAPFFAFARDVLFGDGGPAPQPTAAHRFVRSLESGGSLLRQYTQNVDALEAAAGVQRVVYCHGSFATARCVACSAPHTLATMRARISASATGVPWCEACGGVVRPDIVFFGEALPREFDERIAEDAPAADLLIVVGTSMQVHPVSSIPDMLPPHVPQILVNRKAHDDHAYDIELLGDADAIVTEISRRLGWATDAPEHPTYFVAPCSTLFEGVSDYFACDGSSCESEAPCASD